MCDSPFVVLDLEYTQFFGWTNETRLLLVSLLLLLLGLNQAQRKGHNH
jgi:hypothetical protein